MDPLSEADHGLIDAAEAMLREHHDPRLHTTGAALRAASGAVYTAVSLKAETAAADVHAEPVAVARARLDGETAFETVAAVQFRDGTAETRVVSACGICREVLSRQAPDVSVVVERDGELGKQSLAALLPD